MTLPMPKKSTSTVITSAERVIDRRHSAWREAEDGRDERAGVADADEEDEVGDVEAPEDREVQAGDAEAVAELREPGEQRHRRRWRAAPRR